MKKTLLIILLAWFTSQAYSQDSTNSDIKLKDDKFSINLLINPSFDYEVKIAQRQSLKFSLGLSPIVDKDGDAIGTASFLATAFRLYYSNDSPELSYNSGSYIGLKSKAILDAQRIDGSFFTPDKALQIAAIWGFQENYKSGIYWGGTLGPGIIATTDYLVEFSLLLDLQFGFNL